MLYPLTHQSYLSCVLGRRLSFILSTQCLLPFSRLRKESSVLTRGVYCGKLREDSKGERNQGQQLHDKGGVVRVLYLV